MIAPKPEELIRCLIRGSIQRAICESAACVVILAAFGAILRTCETDSPRYYGCLLIMVAAGFISGVVWSYALSYRLLREHSASDTEFWRAAFASQSRLLRFVPLWYLAPMAPGVVLFLTPKEQYEVPFFLGALLLATGFFAAVAWLNRSAAAQIDSKAAQLS